GPYGFAWAVPTGCAPADAAEISCTAPHAGNFTAQVTVSDANGASADSGPIAFSVTGVPLVGASTGVSRPVDEVGANLTLWANLSSGTAPFTIRWQGLPAGCASANLSDLDCRPTEAGRFSVYATATDATGASVGLRPANLTVVPDPTVRIAQLNGSTPTPNGTAVPLAATVEGGLAPFTIRWTADGTPAGAGTNLTVLVPSHGPVRYAAEVTDALGIQNASNTLNVTAPGTSPLLLTSPPPLQLWGVLLAVAVGVTATGAVLWRLRRPES
ncbi:MAG: hypothetical protein L3K05_05555, partial [Thermoplasmata archaeon]|nr:hypothetical protein [Thermoplasmata archaeon]